MLYFNRPEDENGYLSNRYPATITLNDIHYQSVKQYTLHQKALLFQDLEAAEKILSAQTDAELDAASRNIRDYNVKLWHGARQIIVFRGLIRKFKQNRDLLQQLLNTRDEVLVGCDPDDPVWGIGISLDDPRRSDIDAWPGQNLLGLTLMQVRKFLQE